jgi:hypothetical protein
LFSEDSSFGEEEDLFGIIGVPVGVVVGVAMGVVGTDDVGVCVVGAEFWGVVGVLATDCGCDTALATK